MPLPKYLYRCDYKKNLLSIKTVGFKCGKPSREVDEWAIDKDSIIPGESISANQKGYAIPPDDIILAPRIYFYWKFKPAFQKASSSLPNKLQLVIRFSPIMSSFKNESLYFTDGLFADPTEAAYVCFPNNQIDDVIIKPSQIEVFLDEDKWINLCNYTGSADSDSSIMNMYAKLKPNYF